MTGSLSVKIDGRKEHNHLVSSVALITVFLTFYLKIFLQDCQALHLQLRRFKPSRQAGEAGNQ
jgi:hypothetical protein